MSRHGPRALRATMLVVCASCGSVPERPAGNEPVPSSTDTTDASPPRLVSEALGSAGAGSTGSGTPPPAIGMAGARPAAGEPTTDTDARMMKDASTVRSLSDARSPSDRDEARGDAREAGRLDATGDAREAGRPDATGDAREAGRPDATGDAREAGRPDATGDARDAGPRDATGDAGDAGDGAALAGDGAPCPPACGAPPPHLLISEVVFRPSGAEMIEVRNPTSRPISLDGYAISDSHRYVEIAAGLAAVGSSDFAATFPLGAVVEAGGYRTVALGNAAAFELVHGGPPDFELRPRANGAADDTAVADMVSLAQERATTVGALASLTDEGEPVVLFRIEPSGLVHEVDEVFFGRPSAVNPVLDGPSDDAGARDDAPSAAPERRAVPVAATSVAVQRCGDDAAGEATLESDGGRDATSGATPVAFVATDAASPGAPPPSGTCAR